MSVVVGAAGAVVAAAEAAEAAGTVVAEGAPSVGRSVAADGAAPVAAALSSLPTGGLTINGGGGWADKAARSRARVPEAPHKGQDWWDVTRHNPVGGCRGGWIREVAVSVEGGMGLC